MSGRASSRREPHEATLRGASAADLGAIHEIEASVFGTDAWSGAVLADELTGPHRHYVVLEGDGERILGYAGLLAIGSQGDVQTVAVAPEARGLGLGRRLMRALVAEAAERRVRELFLEVRADNPVARGLYGSLGFEEIGVRPRYYQPDGVDAVVMRLGIPLPGPHDDALAPGAGALDPDAAEQVTEEER